MIKVKGFELPNKAGEMSIEMFEKLSEIIEGVVFVKGMKGKFSYESVTDKYLDVLELIGLPAASIDEMTQDEFTKAVREFNEPSKIKYKMEKTIEVAGKTYVAFTGKKYVLNVIDGEKIEKFARKNPKKYVAEMMAVIFKDESLTKTEHRADAHIKHKASIFRKQLKASVALPYLVMITEKILLAGARQIESNEGAEKLV